MKEYHKRSTCRACGSDELEHVLDLGNMPLANAFITPAQKLTEKKYPLTLSFCTRCQLVQTPDVVDPALVFKDYVYATGVSPPLVEHFRKYAADAIDPLIVSADDVVYDIGGNDGTLLDHIKAPCTLVNVDTAAPELAHDSKPNQVNVRRRFTYDVATDLVTQFGQARIITANNVLAHVDDIRDFLRGVHALLAYNGDFIFEVHWASDMLESGHYDQIYHEHLSYFSLSALWNMLKHAGLAIYDTRIVENHGKSLRVFAKHKGATGYVHQRAINIMASEKQTVETWETFADEVEASRNTLRDLIYDLVDSGAKVAGYGAPAKGTTLLNHCGLGADSIQYVVDGSKSKQGKLVPGVHIPVVEPSKIVEDIPDYALLLSWNYKTHILEKEAGLRAKGTKFIVPGKELAVA